MSTAVPTLPRLAAPPGTTLLHRFTVRPRHLDAWLELWPHEAALRVRVGYRLHRLFVETDAEPKVTLVCSHDDPDAGAAALAAAAEASGLAGRLGPHVFGNVVTRGVRVELLTAATPETVDGRIAIMRRYAITGSWADFLAIWRRIVDVREAYGFRCLFAVSDEPKDLFTWAFDFAGAWEDFPAAQREYYRDRDRVALRDVFHFMADYSIHPARQLLV